MKIEEEDPDILLLKEETLDTEKEETPDPEASIDPILTKEDMKNKIKGMEDLEIEEMEDPTIEDLEDPMIEVMKDMTGDLNPSQEIQEKSTLVKTSSLMMSQLKIMNKKEQYSCQKQKTRLLWTVDVQKQLLVSFGSLCSSKR